MGRAAHSLSIAFTLEGLGGFILAALVGLAVLLIAIRGIRIRIDRKER